MSISFINLNTFSKEELCQFISERCYDTIRKTLQYLEMHYVTDSSLQHGNDIEESLPFLFLQFKNECEQLMAWEAALILPYFQRNNRALRQKYNTKVLNPNLLEIKHEGIQRLYEKVKHYSIYHAHYQNESRFQILKYDLEHFSIQLANWDHLIRTLIGNYTMKATN